MSILKRTVLYPRHKELKARMVPFGQWEMPIYYHGIIEEHLAVRNSAGIFDVSHMGEISVKGKEALSLLQSLTTNNLDAIKPGRAQYNLLCNHQGGVIDDLIIYQINPEEYLLCANAGNTEKVFSWICQNNKTGSEVVNLSEQTGQIAVQGKNSEKILQELSSENLGVLKSFNFIKGEIAGIETLIARTGYTGEDGFELYLPVGQTPDLWKAISEQGVKHDLQIIGLGARDSLRLEMAYMLYGNELNENSTPLEANLNKYVKTDSKDFVGKEILLKQEKEGIKKKLVGFEMVEKCPIRTHYKIFKDNAEVGEVTSGNFSPSLKKFIGLGYVKINFSNLGEEIEIEVRNKKIKAKIVPTPFYQRRK